MNTAMRDKASKRILNRFTAWLALLLLTSVTQAADIVDTAYVAEALARGAIIWDARDAPSYKAGHIPGAVNVGDVSSVLRDPNREDWLPVEQMQTILGRAGIDIIKKVVIVYSRTGDATAYYALSGMRHFGSKNGKVYHGGLDAWQTAGNPISQDTTTLPPVALTLTPTAGVLLWNNDVIARVKEGRTQIVDTRTAKEFTGDDVRAIRGGHIPKAVNVPYEQNWVDPQAAVKLASKEVKTRDGMSLKAPDELQKMYVGLDPDKEVVVYCQSGVRASLTATVLRDLGFRDVKVYEPSWLGYAGVLSAAAEHEVFLNVGALNGRMSSLQGRVTELEAELARVKAAR